MTRKLVLLLILPFILTSCLPDENLKRSANNRLFDTKGFHGKKRRPLYNNKYIDKAKHNVARSDMDLDEFEDDEQYLGNLNPTLKNRYMYEDMVEEDMQSQKSKRAKKREAYLRKMENRDRYYDMREARERIREGRNGEENKELRRELLEIKSMLDSARQDLVKYRCPVDEDGEIIVKKHSAKPKKIQEEIKQEEKSAPAQQPKLQPAPQKKSTKPKAESPKQNIVKPNTPKTPVVQAPTPKKPSVKKEAPKMQAPKTPEVNDAPVAPVANQPVEEDLSQKVQDVVDNNDGNYVSSRLDQNTNIKPTEEIQESINPSVESESQPVYNENSVPSLPQFPLSE